MSIRWRLFGGHLLVVLVGVGSLGLYLDLEMNRRYRRSLEEILSARVGLARESLRPHLSALARTKPLQAAARRLARETGVRLTVVGRDGTVLADSEQDAAAMSSHAGRPEVRQALAGGTGVAVRRSVTLGVPMLYLALPVREGRTTLAVVRGALPMDQIARELRRTRAVVLTAALLAAGLALLLSVRFSLRLGARIRALGQVAERFSRGDFEARVRPQARDEIATVATIFNEMADRLRRSMNELENEKTKLETILEELGEAFIVTDPEARVLRWNQAAARVFGTPAERALGRPVVEATQSHPLDEAFRRAIACNEATTTEVQVLFPQPRILRATVTAVAAEQPLGAVAVLHDITALRRLEAVRREFVANASHELQTPVTAIRALAEALLAGDREDPALAERFLKDLVSQSERLGALVRDLLELAALESGPWPIEREDVSVSEAAQQVVSQAGALAAHHQVSVALEASPDLLVRADRAALHRILANLLDNAIKYTPAGGRVGISAAEENGRVAIAVWDTGIGIPEAALSRVFERFYRVDKARSRELGGTGLGLSIVKHLIELLDGEVRVESKLGQGSRFTVFLPQG